MRFSGEGVCLTSAPARGSRSALTIPAWPCPLVFAAGPLRGACSRLSRAAFRWGGGGGQEQVEAVRSRSEMPKHIRRVGHAGIQKSIVKKTVGATVRPNTSKLDIRTVQVHFWHQRRTPPKSILMRPTSKKLIVLPAIGKARRGVQTHLQSVLVCRAPSRGVSCARRRIDLRHRFHARQPQHFSLVRPEFRLKSTSRSGMAGVTSPTMYVRT